MLHLHPIADLAIAAGCFVIAAAAIMRLRAMRPGTGPSNAGAGVLFVAFVACLGATHVLLAMELTPGGHRLASVVQILAAVAGLACVVVLPPLAAGPAATPDPSAHGAPPATTFGRADDEQGREAPERTSVPSDAARVMEATLRARQLERTLLEKQTLLQEVHHRVKGNLQTITSLLKLRARRVQDPAARVVLEESVNRVRTMALLHETLYRSGNPARVDLPDYLRSVLGNLFRSQDADLSALELSTPGRTPSVDLERAIPLGLLVHELVSNAIRHAFPDRPVGRIRVALSRTAGGGMQLEVADHGIGLPPGMDAGTTSSLGLQLAHSLAEQLGSTLEIERNGGTRFRLTLHDIEEGSA